MLPKISKFEAKSFFVLTFYQPQYQLHIKINNNLSQYATVIHQEQVHAHKMSCNYTYQQYIRTFITRYCKGIQILQHYFAVAKSWQIMRPGCTFKADSGKYFKDEFFSNKIKKFISKNINFENKPKNWILITILRMGIYLPV